MLIFFTSMGSAQVDEFAAIASHFVTNIEHKSSSIAIQPFAANMIISPDQAERLNQRLFKALEQQRPDHIKLIDRTAFLDLWNEARLINEADFEIFLQKQRVDLLIIPRIFRNHDGLFYQASLFRVNDHSTLAASSPIMLQEGVDITAHSTLQAGVKENLHQLLANHIEQIGDDFPIMVIDADLGRTSLLSRKIEDYSKQIAATLIEKRNQRQAAINDDRKALGQAILPPLEKYAYHLQGLVYESVNPLQIQFKLINQSNKLVNKTIFEIDRAFVKKLIDRRSYEAFVKSEGRALIGKDMDHAAAMRAARNLARAKAIAKQLGSPMPNIDVVRSHDEASLIIRYLEQGISFNEVWQAQKASNGEIKLQLKAQIRPFGQKIRFLAATEAQIFRANVQPIHFYITANESADFAVFGWSQDDKVVQLYPYERLPRLHINQGKTLRSPFSGEPDLYSTITSAGRAMEHEALIIIAYPEHSLETALNRFQLTQTAANTVQAASFTGTSYQNFMQNLSNLKLQELSVSILPYQIRN